MQKSESHKDKTKLLLRKIASQAKLREGKDAVRLIIREIYRKGTIGTKKLARKLHIPIPTIAAVRKELEKEGLLDRTNRGAILTEKGIKFVEQDLSIRYKKDLICQSCDGTTIELPFEFDELIKNLKTFTELRPKPLTKYDQAFAKPITSLRRAFLLLQNDDLEGKEVLLLGDDDFTSIAIALLNSTAKITVIDIDKRLLNIIKEISLKNKYQINCIELDLRKKLPKEIMHKFDVIFTDPPYTPMGMQLFLIRALQLLRKEENKKIYLAFAHKPVEEQLELQEIITNMKLTIQQKLPLFNLYEGAEMHGNSTGLTILSTTEYSEITENRNFEEKIYTGEINPTIREYQCVNNHTTKVGFSQEIKTIEELKENGCPICKDKSEFSRLKRYKI